MVTASGLLACESRPYLGATPDEAVYDPSNTQHAFGFAEVIVLTLDVLRHQQTPACHQDLLHARNKRRRKSAVETLTKSSLLCSGARSNGCRRETVVRFLNLQNKGDQCGENTV